MMNARNNDPETSKIAAAFAVADAKVAEVVEAIMVDGWPRADFEIAAMAQERGYTETPDRLRHGRKYLHHTGRLMLVGRTTSPHGRPTRLWKIADDGAAAPIAPATPPGMLFATAEAP